MDKKNYYQILDVSRTANKDDIKKAHRKLALRYHPDKNHTDSAKDKFRAVQEAYEILIDDTKRAQFDRYYKQKTQTTVDPRRLYEEELTKIRNYHKDLLEKANAERQTQSRTRKPSSHSNKNFFHGEILKDVPDDEYEKMVLDRMRNAR